MCVFCSPSHLLMACGMIEDSSLLSRLHFTAELEENTALNTKVWDAAGRHGNDTFPLDNFSYNNSALLDVIFRHVEKTNFSGVTVSGGKEDVTVIASAEVVK